MLNTRYCTFVTLTDVMEYMGYSKLRDDAPDIFNRVTWGDSVYTIVSLAYALDMLYDYLDAAGVDDQTWTDYQKRVFAEKESELLNNYTFVDMES